MTVSKFDKDYAIFSTNDILVDSVNHPGFAVKILKEIWIEELGEHRYIAQYGSVTGDKFVGDKKYGEATPDLVLYSPKQARNNFVATWTPGEEFESGDVLKDGSGSLYLMVNESTVWKLSSGTHASLTYWKNEGKKFVLMKAASAMPFSTYFKIEEI